MFHYGKIPSFRLSPSLFHEPDVLPSQIPYRTSDERAVLPGGVVAGGGGDSIKIEGLGDRADPETGHVLGEDALVGEPRKQCKNRLGCVGGTSRARSFSRSHPTPEPMSPP